MTDALKALAEKFAPPTEVGSCDVALLKGERWAYADGSTSKGKSHRASLAAHRRERVAIDFES